jgi:hypothetical protein
MSITSLTRQRHRHYTSDPDTGERYLLWGGGGVGDGLFIREGSAEHREALMDQGWAENALMDEGEDNILAVYFQAATAPTTFYLGLIESDPANEQETFATVIVNESAGGGYARQQITRDGTGWPTGPVTGGAGREITSTTETFGPATGSAWTAVVSTFLCTNDASGSATGEILNYTALSVSRTLQVGDSLDTDLTLNLA